MCGLYCFLFLKFVKMYLTKYLPSVPFPKCLHLKALEEYK